MDRVSTMGDATRGSAFVSLLLHLLVALVVVIVARGSVLPREVTLEIEIEVPPAPTIDAPPIHAPPLHASSEAPRAANLVALPALIAPKTPVPDLPNDDATSKKQAQNEPASIRGHVCEGEDCVLEDLERCAAGDGDGCVGVGLYYERGRGDAFSAIKWYARGCELLSARACEANKRVEGAMPLGWSHHPFYAPG